MLGDAATHAMAALLTMPGNLRAFRYDSFRLLKKPRSNELTRSSSGAARRSRGRQSGTRHRSAPSRARCPAPSPERSTLQGHRHALRWQPQDRARAQELLTGDVGRYANAVLPVRRWRQLGQQQHPVIGRQPQRLVEGARARRRPNRRCHRAAANNAADRRHKSVGPPDGGHCRRTGVPRKD